MDIYAPTGGDVRDIILPDCLIGIPLDKKAENGHLYLARVLPFPLLGYTWQ